MNVRWWTTVLVVGMVLLSGCTGFGGGDAPAAGDASSGSGGGSGSGSGSGSGDDGSSDGSSGAGDSDAGVSGFQPADSFEDIRTERQMDDYVDRSPFPVYRPGEFLRFEGVNGFSDTENPDPFVLTVESGEGGEWLEADVLVTVEKGGEVVNSEDSPAILFNSEYALTQNGRAWIWLYRFNFVTEREPRISDLSVGDTWQYDAPDDTGDDEEYVPNGFTFEVTEQRTYAGIDCHLVVIDAFEGDESRKFSEACVSPDVGMPLYYIFYQDDGDVLLEAELVEYSR